MSAVPMGSRPWERIKAQVVSGHRDSDGSSVYTLLEVSTIGFMRGRMPSCVIVRPFPQRWDEFSKIFYTGVNFVSSSYENTNG